MHALCRDEFAEEKDGDACWKAFLDGIKGRLSAGEVAKIIDVVGVTGESVIKGMFERARAKDADYRP